MAGARYSTRAPSPYLGRAADIVTEPRWSRANGTFGENPELAAKIAEKMGGIRTGADVAKALALGADAGRVRRRAGSIPAS